MFMRFLGIRISHCGQHVSVEPNLDDPPDVQTGIDVNCDDAEGAEIDEDFQAEDTEDSEEGTGSDDENSDFGYGDL